MSFFIFMGFVFEVHFVLYEYSYCFLSFLFEWNVFFPPLTFHIGASCRQHIVGSCFIVQSSLLYLLIAAFILLAFNYLWVCICCHFKSYLPRFYISSLFLSFGFSFCGLLVFFCIIAWVLFGSCAPTLWFWFVVTLDFKWASPVAQMVKNLPAMRESHVQSLGWEDPLEKDMATHSSIVAWRIPWTEEHFQVC